MLCMFWQTLKSYIHFGWFLQGLFLEMRLELSLTQYRQEGGCIPSRGDNIMCDTEVETDMGGCRGPEGEEWEEQLGKKLGPGHRGPEHQAEE